MKYKALFVFFILIMLCMNSVSATCNIIVITDPTGEDPNGAAAGSMSFAENMFQSTFLMSKEGQYVVLSGGTGSSDTRLDSIIEALASLQNNASAASAASVASDDIKAAEFVQKHCSVPSKFRLYTNSDVIGVELGGSLKNVIAIDSGFADAMKLGDNCRGSLLTRGMAEIVRVSVALGAKPSTLYGLSGMGDLIATCSSPFSRNFTVGSMLGKGKKIDDILSELGSVAEGVKTSKALCDLAQKLGVEVPVSSAIYEAVYTDITPDEVLNKLMNRKLKQEEEYN